MNRPSCSRPLRAARSRSSRSGTIPGASSARSPLSAAASTMSIASPRRRASLRSSRSHISTSSAPPSISTRGTIGCQPDPSSRARNPVGRGLPRGAQLVEGAQVAARPFEALEGRPRRRAQAPAELLEPAVDPLGVGQHGDPPSGSLPWPPTRRGRAAVNQRSAGGGKFSGPIPDRESAADLAHRLAGSDEVHLADAVAGPTCARPRPRWRQQGRRRCRRRGQGWRAGRPRPLRTGSCAGPAVGRSASPGRRFRRRAA